MDRSLGFSESFSQSYPAVSTMGSFGQLAEGLPPSHKMVAATPHSGGAKSHKLPYSKSNAPTSVGRHNYYVSFIDDFSKYTWIYLLKKKSDVFQAFRIFQNFVERKINRKIITMQTDWGEEYEKLHSFFQQIGIAHHVSCPHAHQQNGSAERKHRHIVDVGLALLAKASVPLKF
ncbi:hypothetical protein U9M48_029805 [Paspalum notatum var. saurae]|uniref:Integrase catalytic domain-containing protein n=1 Tax=Paspalum notatum var. saurae TaxID=547442 RepID=A0AAQ3X2K7_PASNO